jgi:hypothetical protein
VTMVIVVLGGYVTAAALSEPTGRPVGVAGLVRIRPLSGWELVQRGRIGGIPLARLTRGSANLDVAAGRVEDDAVRLASGYVDGVLRDQLPTVSISRPSTVQLASGAAGVRFGYVGSGSGSSTPIEGQVTVVVTSVGTGVVFDAWAPEGLFSFALGDIQTMIDRAEIGP